MTLVCGAQMSKTETAANVMGHRLDDDPTTILYAAPTRSFIETVFAPRFNQMVQQCASLRAKTVKDIEKQKSTFKDIAGVNVRFAWAGSATEMSGQPACKVFLDELDRMPANVEGEGSPKELADARHSTFPDGQTVIFSTPTMGNVETVVENGLEFWDWGDEIESATWKMFQEGTRFHWAVPCPHCEDYFIPRFKLLNWADGSTPSEANGNAGLVCPHCGAFIEQSHKDEMHQSGRYVAPGQTIDKEGNVFGEPPASSSASFWVSGLMSPWKTWGDRAEAFLNAVRDGDPERIQAVINTGFGELYSVAGEVPELATIQALRQDYPLGGEVLIEGAIKLTLGVDVQKERLVYSVRAWGANLESWHVDQGEIMGPTDELDVWNTLGSFKDRTYGAMTIERAFIDSGYRTQYVYDFCRKHKGWAFPTKGRDTIEATPLQRSKLDVTKNSGRRKAAGLGIWHINTDYFKRWLHERFERDPSLPGGWHLSRDTTDDFCKAMVSEARLVKPSGRVAWQLIHKNNHFFDCEVNNIAAAYSLNMQTITTESVKAEARRIQQASQEKPQETQKSVDPFRSNKSGGGFFSGNGGWYS